MSSRLIDRVRGAQQRFKAGVPTTDSAEYERIKKALHAELRIEAETTYAHWRNRIAEGGLDLELIDLEWTLDRRKLVLYVLGGRGADTTKLALLAAAEGLTAIEVQPVAAEGVVPLPAAGGGCGSGGCGCHT